MEGGEKIVQESQRLYKAKRSLFQLSTNFAFEIPDNQGEKQNMSYAALII